MESLSQLIRRLGIRANLRGYRYLIYAVELVRHDYTYLLNVTKRLYPAVAQHFETTVGSVDRNLRTVLHILWERGNLSYLEQVAGYPISYRPNNSELIDILASCRLTHTEKESLP